MVNSGYHPAQYHDTWSGGINADISYFVINVIGIVEASGKETASRVSAGYTCTDQASPGNVNVDKCIWFVIYICHPVNANSHGFAGSMAMSPMSVVTDCSKMGSQLTPSLTVFHTPPDETAT